MSAVNLENMWSDEAKKWETIFEELGDEPSRSPKEYILPRYEKIPGVCGGSYVTEFVENSHPSKTIEGVIKVVATYRGATRSSTKRFKLYSTEEVELGCTGWANPTGADTTYSRTVISAWYVQN